MRAALASLLAMVTIILLAHAARAQLSDGDTLRRLGQLVSAGNGYYQVRIEQRVIIRIPRQNSAPASTKERSKTTQMRYKEEKIGNCLLMDKLIASRPATEKSLDLVTTDGVLIRSYLRDCSARDFYAGAYMERSGDGKLCVKRDLLHARTGTKCEIDKFRLLVPQ